MDPTQLPLRDIHLPGPIGWWPPSLGWWLLGLALLGLVVASVVYVRRWRRQRPLREALANLDAAAAEVQAGRLPAALQLVSQTVRRTAITLANEAAAGLTGDAWLEWLDSRWPREDFRRGAGQLLASAPYRTPGDVSHEQASDVLEMARAWIRAQRIGGSPR